ncbi:hypothetical protein [Paenibacillus wenxiniae]|uniref:Glycosyltransferase n=1 Tax=Paenibacillus wenxiniae TaxID=1636843 RepID=A0ABW4RFF4_9BACL
MSLQPAAVIVIGMHRSGTSLLAGVIRALGVHFGKEEQMVAPREDNPEGFWEHAEIVTIHDELLRTLSSSWDTTQPLPYEWWLTEEVQPFRQRLIQVITRDFAHLSLWGFKDPRASLLLPLWQSVLDELQIDVRYVMSLRNPLNVADSLYKRDQFDYDKSLAMYHLYMLSCLHDTYLRPRILIDYDQLIEQPVETGRKISAFLNIPYTSADEAQISLLSKPSLRHSRRSVQDVWDDVSIPSAVRHTYELALIAEQESEPVQGNMLHRRIQQAYEQLLQAQRLLYHPQSHRIRIYWAEADAPFGEDRSTYISVHPVKKKSVHIVEFPESPGSALRIDFFAQPAYIKLSGLSLLNGDHDINLLHYPVKGVHFLAFSNATTHGDSISGITTDEKSYIVIHNLPACEGKVRLRLELLYSFELNDGMIRAFQAKETMLTHRLQDADAQQAALLALHAQQEEMIEQAAAHIEQQIEILELLCEEGRRREERLQAVSLELQTEQVETTRLQLELEKQEQQLHNEYNLLLRQKKLEIDKYKKEASLYADSLSWKITLPLRIIREVERNTRKRCRRWAKRLLQGYTIRRERHAHSASLNDRLPYKQYALMFSHTNYLESMGGTEKYIHEQVSHLSESNIGIIQIYPGQRYLFLDMKEDTYYGVVVGNQFRGFYSIREIAAWLSSIHPRLVHMYTHHLLNWQNRDYRMLLQQVETDVLLPHTFFMHDFFAVCSSYHMMYESRISHNVQKVQERYTCIPDIIATAGQSASICQSCIHGTVLKEWRQALEPTLLQVDRVIVPSEFVRETVIAVYPEMQSKLLVQEHLIFDNQKVVTKPKPDHRKIRLAYLGYRMDNKGWSTWERLYQDDALSRLYEFHHIGSQEHYSNQVIHHRYSFLREGTMGASNLLITQDIDLVVLWSIVPESYSYTLQEAIAAGIPVLTSPISGNIAATIDAHPEIGKVFSDEQELKAFLLDSDYVRAYVAGERARYTLTYNHLPTDEREVRS